MRLQRVVVDCAGISRRKAGELILKGHVQVNGSTVTSPGFRVDPRSDEVKLDGAALHSRDMRREAHYILYFKPRGMVSTMSDPEGRPCLGDVTNLPRGRLFPAGRLDFNTDGLIVLTDDGELAQKIAHPRYGCRKTYRVKVRGVPEKNELDRLRAGVVLDGKRTKPAQITIIPGKVRNSQLLLNIGEGKKNQIRRMFEMIGHPVVRLTREAIGTVRARGIAPGEHRRLTGPEIKSLRRPGAQSSKPGRKRGRPRSARGKTKNSKSGTSR